MDILNIFKKKVTAKDVKEKFINFSTKKSRLKKALKYLTHICNNSPKKCVMYKKIFFTVYKDIETKESAQVGDQIVEELKDDSFTKVLAILHKRLGNIRRYEQLIAKIPPRKTVVPLKQKNLKETLETSANNVELKHNINEILNCDEKDKMENYKLIFSYVKDEDIGEVVNYGMLYFKQNPFDRKFESLLRSRLEEVKEMDNLKVIAEYNEYYRYIMELKKGVFLTNSKFDKKKFHKQIKIISNKVPSVFLKKYITFTIGKYSDYKEQIAKGVFEICKDTNISLAVKYGKIYLAKNKHDIKFKKVLIKREKLYKQEIIEKDFLESIRQSKYFLSQKLSIKNYITVLSKAAKKFDDSLLVKIINIFLVKFLSQKEQILRNTFSILKDSHPEVAIPFGVLYIEKNLKDIKFAKVLLKRLQKFDENEQRIVLSKKLFNATMDESFEYIFIEDEIRNIIEECELLYIENKKRPLNNKIDGMILHYPKYKILIYRKLLKFYSKKEYKRAEKYALKALKIKYNEYVVKELYDLHITHGFIQKALSVLPENTSSEILKLKKKMDHHYII